VKRITAQKITWIGHIVRMDKRKTMKRLKEWRPFVVSRIDRASLRWEDVVIEGLGKIKIHNWSKMAMDRKLSIWLGRVVAPREKGYV
jgi:hypothetical protein